MGLAAGYSLPPLEASVVKATQSEEASTHALLQLLSKEKLLALVLRGPGAGWAAKSQTMRATATVQTRSTTHTPARPQSTQSAARAANPRLPGRPIGAPPRPGWPLVGLVRKPGWSPSPRTSARHAGHRCGMALRPGKRDALQITLLSTKPWWWSRLNLAGGAAGRVFHAE